MVCRQHRYHLRVVDQGQKRTAQDDAPPPVAKRPRVRTPPATTSSPLTSPIFTPLVKGKNKLKEGGARVGPYYEDEISRTFSGLRYPQSKGMHNPNNLCYRNASLQALFHSPQFYHFLGIVHQDCYVTSEYCVVCALQELIWRYWNVPGIQPGNSGVTEVSRGRLEVFTAACKKSPPRDVQTAEEIEKDRQSDAFMFIDYLVRECLPEVHGMDASLLRDFFELEYEQSWTCRHCGNESRSQDKKTGQLGLTVEFSDKEKGHGVPWYLHNGFFYEKIAIWCDSNECKERRDNSEAIDGPRRLFKRLITRAPEVLVVRIARFKFTEESTVSKIDQRVRYPEFLNLNAYRGQNLTRDCVYRLDGVVGHRGKTTRKGHYIAAARDLSGRYEVMNDSREILSSSNFKTMEAFNKSGDVEKAAFSPFVCIYSRL